MDNKLIKILQESDLFSGPDAGDLQKRQAVRNTEKEQILQSLKQTFPKAKLGRPDELEQIISDPSTAVFMLLPGSEDNRELPIYDPHEELDRQAKMAAEVYGFRGNIGKSYYEGVSNEFNKWAEQHGITLVHYSDTVLLGYLN